MENVVDQNTPNGASSGQQQLKSRKKSPQIANIINPQEQETQPQVVQEPAKRQETPAARGRGRPPSKLNKVENANYIAKETNLRKRSLIDTQLQNPNDNDIQKRLKVDPDATLQSMLGPDLLISANLMPGRRVAGEIQATDQLAQNTLYSQTNLQESQQNPRRSERPRRGNYKKYLKLESGAGGYNDYNDDAADEGEGPQLIQSQMNHRTSNQLNTQASTRHPMTQSTYRLHHGEHQSISQQRTLNEDQVLAGDELVEVPIPSSDEEQHQHHYRPQVHEQGRFMEEEDATMEEPEDDDIDEIEGGKKKKDKKLVFLSRSVLEKIKERPMTTGTQIANEILELYKRFSAKVDFKNVQRRVYDALNVLNAMDIIKKDRNHIFYNPKNTIIPDSNFSQPPINDAKIESEEDLIRINAEKQRMRQKQLVEIERLKKQIEEKKNSIRQKEYDLILQIKQVVTIKKLLKRNYEKTCQSANSKQKDTIDEFEAHTTDKLMSVPPKLEQNDKISTMIEDPSATRMSQSLQNSYINSCDKIYLPIAFARFKTVKGQSDVVKGGLEVAMSDDGQMVNIYSDQKAKVFNEFHLLERLGLSEASDTDLKSILYKELYDFIDERKHLEIQDGNQLNKGEYTFGNNALSAGRNNIDSQKSKYVIKKFSPLMIVNNNVNEGGTANNNERVDAENAHLNGSSSEINIKQTGFQLQSNTNINNSYGDAQNQLSGGNGDIFQSPQPHFFQGHHLNFTALQHNDGLMFGVPNNSASQQSGNQQNQYFQNYQFGDSLFNTQNSAAVSGGNHNHLQMNVSGDSRKFQQNNLSRKQSSSGSIKNYGISASLLLSSNKQVQTRSEILNMSSPYTERYNANSSMIEMSLFADPMSLIPAPQMMMLGGGGNFDSKNMSPPLMPAPAAPHKSVSFEQPGVCYLNSKTLGFMPPDEPNNSNSSIPKSASMNDNNNNPNTSPHSLMRANYSNSMSPFSKPQSNFYPGKF